MRHFEEIFTADDSVREKLPFVRQVSFNLRTDKETLVDIAGKEHLLKEEHFVDFQYKFPYGTFVFRTDMALSIFQDAERIIEEEYPKFRPVRTIETTQTNEIDGVALDFTIQLELRDVTAN